MTSSPLDKLEQWVSYMLMRIAPVWYASQIISTQKLPESPTINPLTSHAEHWFDLEQGLKYASETLYQGPAEWHLLAKDISKLALHKPLNRKMSLLRLTGALELPEKYKSYTTLREATLADDELIEYESSSEFEAAGAAIPPQMPLVYREWDGRVQAQTLADDSPILSLLRYAAIHKRDISLSADVLVETIKPEPLERIRAKYWWFLLHKDSATILTQLFHQCGFHATHTGALPDRPQHAFFFTHKRNKRINRLILTLMTQHKSTQLTEFGRYLSTHKHGFRNQ